MDAPLTQGTAVAIALVLAISLGAISFVWPDNVFRRSAWAAVCALVGPIAIAILADPFLGSGAGLGVALILSVLAAAILLGAFAAVVGAVCRYIWNAWRRAAT